MPIQALLPVALGALGAYQGYRSAKDSGASGIGRLLGAGLGGFGGYTMGTSLGGMMTPAVTSSGFLGSGAAGGASATAQKALAEEIAKDQARRAAKGNLLDVFLEKVQAVR